MSVQQATIGKSNQVTTGARKGGKLVAMAAHQAVSHIHTTRQVTDVCAPAPNTNSLNNATQIKYFIKKDTCREVKTIMLRFQIKMDTQGQLIMTRVSKPEKELAACSCGKLVYY